MKRSDVLSLTMKEVFAPEFVREVIDRNGLRDAESPRATLLRSRTTITKTRVRVLRTFTSEDEDRRIAVLAFLTASEVRCMAQLGEKTLRWLEEYLLLLGVRFAQSDSVHGMSPEAQEFLESLD